MPQAGAVMDSEQEGHRFPWGFPGLAELGEVRKEPVVGEVCRTMLLSCHVARHHDPVPCPRTGEQRGGRGQPPPVLGTAWAVQCLRPWGRGAGLGPPCVPHLVVGAQKEGSSGSCTRDLSHPKRESYP